MKRVAFLMLLIGVPWLMAVDQVPVYRNGIGRPPYYSVIPSCASGSALNWDGGSHDWQCTSVAAPDAGPTALPVAEESASVVNAETLNFIGPAITAVAAGTTANITVVASGTGACAANQYVHTLNNGAAPTCGTPIDTDTKGSYVYTGYVPWDYPSGTQFQAYYPLHDSKDVTLAFTATEQGTGADSTALLQIYDRTNSTVICDKEVLCTMSVGSTVSTSCPVTGIPANAEIVMWWSSESNCTALPGGNVALTVDED